MNRRAAIVVCLVAAGAFAQVTRHSSRTRYGLGLNPKTGGVSRASRAGTASAYFEFAPASGAGLGSACACSAVTGAKGEALSLTRASLATCTKGGFRTTGIADGDLVSCSNNLPRVELDANSVLGVLIEGARTNSLLRSQELAAAPWSTSAVGVAVPTLTADFGVAPDGTSTAERVQFPACPTSGHSSAVFQSVTTTAAAWTNSIYVKGNGTSGAILLWIYDTGASAGTGVVCNFVAATWSRCSVTRTQVGAGGSLGFGCYNEASLTNRQNTGAADVLVWGGQVELGAWASSYVPTVSSTVTRAVDPGLTGTLSSAVGPTLCIAGSAQFGSTSIGAANIVRIGDGAAQAVVYRNSDTQAGYVLGTVASTTPTVASMGFTTHRSLLSDNAGTRSAFWDNGSVSAPAATMASGKAAFYIGADTAGTTQANGIVSRVQIDPSPTRCSAQ